MSEKCAGIGWSVRHEATEEGRGNVYVINHEERTKCFSTLSSQERGQTIPPPKSVEQTGIDTKVIFKSVRSGYGDI